MRLENWPERLWDVVQYHTDAPFAWGSCDMVTFPVACALAISNPSASPNIEGYYEDAEGLAALFEMNEWEDISGAYEDMGLEEIPPSLAQRGDLGVMDQNGELVGCVFVDAAVLWKSQLGMKRVDRSNVLRAFRVV